MCRWSIVAAQSLDGIVATERSEGWKAIRTIGDAIRLNLSGEEKRLFAFYVGTAGLQF